MESGTETQRSLLEPKLLRRLEHLELVVKRLAKSSARGERRSRARGQSVEFADYRNYVAGDDLRYLDWNLYGRLGKLFLKLYEEEREQPVSIFLDRSESMSFGEPRKFDFARQVAAAVGYVTLSGFDRVQLTVIPELDKSSAAATRFQRVQGTAARLRWLRDLETLTPGGQGGFNDTLRRASLETQKPGVAVVVSDFLDAQGYEVGLKSLVARGFQIHAIQILSSEEWMPSTFGDLRLVDCETGDSREVSFGKFRLKEYQKTVQRYIDQLAQFCMTRGIFFAAVRSDASLETLLLRQFRESALWK